MVMRRQLSAKGVAWDFCQPLASNSASNQLGFYEVTPDGKKILLDLVAQQVSQSVTVLSNFAAGLKSKSNEPVGGSTGFPFRTLSGRPDPRSAAPNRVFSRLTANTTSSVRPSDWYRQTRLC
jgi:hypothetical protein